MPLKLRLNINFFEVSYKQQSLALNDMKVIAYIRLTSEYTGTPPFQFSTNGKLYVDYLILYKSKINYVYI